MFLTGSTLPEINWDEGLDLGGDKPLPQTEPIVKGVYPESLQHVLIDWDQTEEELQCAALGWFLLSRKKNPFILIGDAGHFTFPVSNKALWLASRERIVEWAWLERGGLDLEEMHEILLKRQHLRFEWTPARKPTDFPAPPAPNPKEYSNVRKRKPSDTDRKPGPRPRSKNDARRNGGVPLFTGNNQDMER